MKGITVCSFGQLYRLSKRSYKKLLLAIANEQDYNLETLGTCIGYIQTDVTDLTPEYAECLLEAL